MEKNSENVVRDYLKTCPRCESSNVVKVGKEIVKKGTFQRRRCKNCGLLYLGELTKRFPVFEEEKVFNRD
jgi:transposase-like protein